MFSSIIDGGILSQSKESKGRLHVIKKVPCKKLMYQVCFNEAIAKAVAVVYE